MREKRIEWIDVTRIVAMLLVIYGHCHYYRLLTDFGGIDYSVDKESYSLAFRVFSVSSNFVYSFHMPLFMMISGMCYNFTAMKTQTWYSFVYDKFVRLIIPFFFVTLFLNVPMKWFSGYWNNSPSFLSDMVLGQFFLMGNSHLWFVVSLFWIFLCADIIIKWQVKIGQCKHIVVISTLVLLNIISTIFQYDYLGIPNAMQYLLYFYLGYYLLPIINKWKDVSIIYILLSFVLWFIFLYGRNRLALTFELDPFIQTLNSFLYIIGAVGASISCCLLCKYLYIKNIRGSLLKNNTYELYLYSDPINYLILYISWSLYGDIILTDNVATTIMVIIRFCGSLAFAFLIIYIVKLLELKELRKLIYHK